MFGKLHEKIGEVKGQLSTLHQKQDLQLTLLRELREGSVKKDEFNLFKKVSYGVTGVIFSIFSYMFIK